MCTAADCVCVAIVGTMCLVITDNVYFDAKSVQIIIKLFNDHLGLLRPLFQPSFFKWLQLVRALGYKLVIKALRFYMKLYLNPYKTYL